MSNERFYLTDEESLNLRNEKVITKNVLYFTSEIFSAGRKFDDSKKSEVFADRAKLDHVTNYPRAFSELQKANPDYVSPWGHKLEKPAAATKTKTLE